MEFTAEDDKKYRIQGPEYRVHSHVTFIAPGINVNGFDIEENDQKQSVVVKRGKYSSEYQFSIGDNPLEHRYPRGTKIEVFYDPKAPKKGYVKRYCDKRFMFWIFQGIAAFCALSCILIILILILSA